MSDLVEITAVHPKDGHYGNPAIIGLQGHWEPGSPKASKGPWWSGRLYVDKDDCYTFVGVQYRRAFTDAERYAFLKDHAMRLEDILGYLLWSLHLKALPGEKSLDNTIDRLLREKAPSVGFYY